MGAAEALLGEGGGRVDGGGPEEGAEDGGAC